MIMIKIIKMNKIIKKINKIIEMIKDKIRMESTQTSGGDFLSWRGIGICPVEILANLTLFRFTKITIKSSFG